MVRKGRRNTISYARRESRRESRRDHGAITARLRRGRTDLAVGIDPKVAAFWPKGELDRAVEYSTCPLKQIGVSTICITWAARFPRT